MVVAKSRVFRVGCPHQTPRGGRMSSRSSAENRCHLPMMSRKYFCVAFGQLGARDALQCSGIRLDQIRIGVHPRR